MKKENQHLKRSSYIKRITVLAICIVVFISFDILLGNFSWKSFILPAFFVFIGVLLRCMRNLSLNKMMRIDLDFYTAYELDKSKKNERHNLLLSLPMFLFSGDFQQVNICSDKILQLTKKPQDIEATLFIKILALFLMENTDSLDLLIEQKRQIKKGKKSTAYDNVCIIFIEQYLKGEYNLAIGEIQNWINNYKKNKGNNIENIIKVILYYLMRMAFLKKGDEENAQKCLIEILVADKERKTYFSKSIYES